jgi:hypothetical protein
MKQTAINTVKERIEGEIRLEAAKTDMTTSMVRAKF